MNDGPSFETDVWEYYSAGYPGQVQVLGADLWNGTTAQLQYFHDVTGATYPLLLNGATATGGDLSILYGPADNWVIMNKQGIVRYHAANLWPFGNRYHLDELRGTIDSLVSNSVSVEPAPPARDFALVGSPNPFRGVLALDLALPKAVREASVSVFDPAGRRIARLHDGPLAAGTARLAWDGRGDDGGRVATGLYLVVADLDGVRIQRRVVRLR